MLGTKRILTMVLVHYQMEMVERSIITQKRQKCSIHISVLCLGKKTNDVVTFYDNTLSIPLVSQKDVKQQLLELGIFKSAHPDNFHPRVLKGLAEKLVGLLKLIFNKTWNTGKVPEYWKKANVPIFKTGKRDYLGNQRPVSLTQIPNKITEQLIRASINKN